MNADALVSTGTGIMGYNMFAYCDNNPVVYSDPNGTDRVGLYDPRSMLLGAGGAIGFGAAVIGVRLASKGISLWEMLCDTVVEIFTPSASKVVVKEEEKAEEKEKNC